MGFAYTHPGAALRMNLRHRPATDTSASTAAAYNAAATRATAAAFPTAATAAVDAAAAPGV
jgi:hypothetical protein